jgi:fluoride exporter
VTTVPRLWVVSAVAVGGALGTIGRYELALAEPVGTGRFPWATFLANMVGSLLLGIALAAFVDGHASSLLFRPLVGVGFCGGLTTFSTWMVESVLLVRDGDPGLAVTYVGVSLVAGVAAVAVGIVVTRQVLHRGVVPRFDPEHDE